MIGWHNNYSFFGGSNNIIADCMCGKLGKIIASNFCSRGSIILFPIRATSYQIFGLKRFYTRETLKSIRIFQLAKIPTLCRDWLRSLVYNLSGIKGKGVIKTLTVVHIMPRYLLIYY